MAAVCCMGRCMLYGLVERGMGHSDLVHACWPTCLPRGTGTGTAVGAPPMSWPLVAFFLPRDRPTCILLYFFLPFFWPTSLVAHVAICHVKIVAHVAMLSRFGEMWTVLLVLTPQPPTSMHARASASDVRPHLSAHIVLQSRRVPRRNAIGPSPGPCCGACTCLSKLIT